MPRTLYGTGDYAAGRPRTLQDSLPEWLQPGTDLHDRLAQERRLWLVTGAAGFIGSHLVEVLLRAGQRVRGLDNFATGRRCNLIHVEAAVGPKAWAGFQFVEADIRDFTACECAASGAQIVLHQAALGSVPRSLADPITTNAVNVSGFLNMLEASRTGGADAFVYAASSSTYGDEPNLPKREERIGRPLSPYAVTKLANEIYADVWARSYGFAATGLRYFNVFGPRQDPNGAYAAVIPRWTAAMITDQPVTINGDGRSSRDFCYVANAVQANIRAAFAPAEARGQVYNVAVGEQTDLLGLFALIRDGLRESGLHYDREPLFANFRAGDVRHSLADIGKATQLLGYRPTHSISDGMRESVRWYVRDFLPKMEVPNGQE